MFVFLICFMVFWVMFSIYTLLFSLHHVCVVHAYILMLLCFINCMFGWSFALLCDHCNHFFMTVLVYDQVAHMFHIMFTWSQFTCYIILVLLLLVLPWGFNVFCASVQITGIYVPSSSQLLDLGVCVLPLFSNSCLSLESVLSWNSQRGRL